MTGRARDLLTTPGGDAVVVAEAELTAVVDGTSRVLQSLDTEPPLAGGTELLGAVVGPGFRGRVDAAAPRERDLRTPLYLLLDDLPGAALVSGYALLSEGAAGRVRDDAYLTTIVDLCAGWASDGSMMQLIREHGQNPTPLGPRAPDLRPDDDPIALHALPELPPTGMRRFRRVDVTAPVAPGGLHEVDAFLRDSHVDRAGIETAIHEYSVVATVDATSRTIVDIAASPNVLPWQECPAAIGSATRLRGHELADLRAHVRATFVGTSTCTHLNDVLRGLADVDVLLERLVPVE